MLLKRRDLLLALPVVCASVCLPWKLGAFATGLTSADRALLFVIARDRTEAAGPVSRVQVHQLYYERMSITDIDGIEIEVLDSPLSADNNITYYRISYGPTGISSSARYDEVSYMGTWIRNCCAQIDKRRKPSNGQT